MVLSPAYFANRADKRLANGSHGVPLRMGSRTTSICTICYVCERLSATLLSGIAKYRGRSLSFALPDKGGKD